jgi:hypothetical protein
MPVAQRIAVRNLMKGPTVMSLDPNNVKNYIFWEAAGDPKGNDIKFISEDAAGTPEFQQALKRRIVAVVGDEATVDEAMDRQTTAWFDQQDKATEAIEKTIAHTPKSELITLECVAQQGGKACGSTLMMREERSEVEPPLCDLHAYQAPDFTRQEGRDAEGKTVWRWERR